MLSRLLKESHFADFIVCEISGWDLDGSYTIDETAYVMQGTINGTVVLTLLLGILINICIYVVSIIGMILLL